MVVFVCLLVIRNPRATYQGLTGKCYLSIMRTRQPPGIRWCVSYPLLPCHLDKQLLKGHPGCPSCCLAWVTFPTALTLLLFLHAVLGGQSKSKYTCEVPCVSSLHPSQGTPSSPCPKVAYLGRVELARTGRWCD